MSNLFKLSNINHNKVNSDAAVITPLLLMVTFMIIEDARLLKMFKYGI